MEVFKNECKFNFITHLLFPARTMIKELIYWPTELAAAIIFFIYIIQMDVVKIETYKGLDATVSTNRLQTNSDPFVGIPYLGDKPFGIWFDDQAFTIQRLDTDLLNREYAWICLCYMIKHFLYIIDFALLLKRQKCKMWDVLTHILNLGIWVLWGIYGWTQANMQIHGGMYLRYTKDKIFGMDLSTDALYKTQRDEFKVYTDRYNSIRTWQWLWIPCGAVAAINFILWILGIIMKRSSAYTGQALSTVAIPCQLLVLHLFMKGSWIRSERNNTFLNFTTAEKARFSNGADYFEARWVFFIIYLSAWAGLIASLACVLRAHYAIHIQKDFVKGIKYILYHIFWGSAFIWILFLDNTLYHYFINWRGGLIVTQAICMVLALLIWVLSFLEKRKEGDSFLTRHDNWAKWWYSTDNLCGNMADAQNLGYAKNQTYPGATHVAQGAYPNQPTHPTSQHPGQVSAQPADSKLGNQPHTDPNHPAGAAHAQPGTQIYPQQQAGVAGGEQGRPYIK